MMLPTTGPTTSLMEDLGVLGLVEGADAPAAKSNAKGKGYAKPDPDGGDFAGSPPEGEGGYYKEGDFAVDAGDKAAGPRRNVPVRSGGLNRAAVGPDASNPAQAAEDEYWDDEDVVSESNGKMVPSFLIPSEAEVMEAEEEAQELAEEDRLQRAWEVVQSYFTEDEDGLNEEGLRGVCNAMGYALNTAVEDIANLTVENERLAEAVNELTGLIHEMDDSDEDDSDDDGDDDDEAAYMKFMKAKKKQKKADADDEMEESYGRRANLSESYELASLASELHSLGESRGAAAIDRQSGIIESYEELRDTCADIVEGIIDVMLDDAGLEEGSELDVDESDERVQIARFFEGIVEDANRYLYRLSDGDVPFKIAEADLSKLHSDVQKGIDAMHSVA